jgi:glucan phosphoethanolaminetransferase (alkaline phosphatase superfamily)
MPLNQRSLLAALLGILCAPLAVTLVWACRTQQAWRCVLVVGLTAFLVLALIAGLARTWRRFALVAFPLLVLAAAYTALELQLGMAPGRAIALLVLSCAPEDIIGGLKVTGAVWQVPAIVGVLCAYLWSARRLTRQPIFSPPVLRAARVALVVCVPLVAIVAANASDLIDGLAINPLTGPLIFVSGFIPRAHAELRGALVHKVPYGARRDGGGEEVHILVVGESERRDSWSAYGYSRPTTPYLDRLRSEAIFLQKAFADANLTEWSVPMMLTGIAPQEFDTTAVRGNIVDVAKEAGYSTTWLINQDIQMATMIGITPDRLDCPMDVGASIFGRHVLDETLLPAFRREVQRTGAPRFIGIHMMGSHWEYYRRYPPAFQRFGDASRLNGFAIFASDRNKQWSRELVDSYDNTVLYTDWFLQQVIEAARKLKVPATVTYFPDHGEDLYALDGQIGHGQPAYTPHAFELPAFVWMNSAYRAAHPQVYAALAGNASKEIRTHNVFYTEAQLMGISLPGNTGQQSFASDRFAPDTTRQHIAGGVLVRRPADSAAGPIVAATHLEPAATR